jgi:hypothetical protein
LHFGNVPSIPKVKGAKSLAQQFGNVPHIGVLPIIKHKGNTAT